MKNDRDLSDYREDVYSQNGEDGIIREILRRMRPHISLNSWCVEFGAWDGVHLSNTCRLIREENFSAVLIEGDKRKAGVLSRNFPEDQVLTLCSFVHFEGEDTLDQTLLRTSIPKDFDFLSIDVDGVDFHIFESLQHFTPKIICIEYNPTIPNSVEFIQARDFGVKQGSSARAIVRLARQKSYSLVAQTHCNLIFVSNHLRDFVVHEEQFIENLNPSGNDATVIFSGMDGTILSNRESIKLPWHGLNIPLAKFQVLPQPLRLFPGDYGIPRRVLFKVWKIYYRLKQQLLGTVWR